MPDLLANEYITLSELVKRVGSINGRTVDPSTAWRWAHRGVGGVRLEVGRIGGTTVTTWDAYLRFDAAIKNKPAAAPGGPPAPPAKQNKTRIKSADEILRKAGIRRPKPQPAA